MLSHHQGGTLLLRQNKNKHKMAVEKLSVGAAHKEGSYRACSGNRVTAPHPRLQEERRGGGEEEGGGEREGREVEG